MKGTSAPVDGFGRFPSSYLILSAASGVVELGIPLAAIHAGLPLAGVLLVGLGYQAGGLARYLPLRSTRTVRVIALLSAVCALAVTRQPWLLPPVAAALAAAVQALRDATQSGNVPTWLKRSARVGGFVLSPILAIYPTIAMVSVAIAAASFGLRTVPMRTFVGRDLKHQLALKVNMLVHQAHYFCYAYVLLYLLANQLAMPPMLVAVVFAAGWISYTAAPGATSRMLPIAAFVVGHVLVALMLGSIALTMTDARVVVVAWIATGFGGGTVYVLRQLAASRELPDGEMDAWEDIGHISGVVVALGVAHFSRGEEPQFWVAAALALVAAVLMVSITGRVQGRRTGGIR